MEQPAHLLPAACYVCGSPGPHPEGQHRYWSNEAAAAEFAKQPGPPAGYSPEAAYVAQYRPY